MGDTVTVEFEKADGTEGELVFENVDTVDVVGSPGVGYDLILYRKNDTNGTINNIEEYSESWE